MDFREIENELNKLGYVLTRQSKHYIFMHPNCIRPLTVTRSNKEFGRKLVSILLKKAIRNLKG